jgi:hypothetical protein
MCFVSNPTLGKKNFTWIIFMCPLFYKFQDAHEYTKLNDHKNALVLSRISFSI